jgi:hypothetical protein
MFAELASYRRVKNSGALNVDRHYETFALLLANSLCVFLPIQFLFPTPQGDPRRTISECIAFAKAHEEETGKAPVLDPDFAEDVKRNSQPP